MRVRGFAQFALSSSSSSGSILFRKFLFVLLSLEVWSRFFPFVVLGTCLVCFFLLFLLLCIWVFVCDSVSLPQPHHHRENSNCFPLLLILLSEETSIFDLIVSEKIRLFFPLLIPSVCTASRKEGTSRLGRER